MTNKTSKIRPPFIYEGILIHDDTMDETGRFPVDPRYYNEDLKEKADL